jgi:hypothetical protein
MNLCITAISLSKNQHQQTEMEGGELAVGG